MKAIEIHWKSSTNCLTYPSAVFVFSIANPEVITQPSDEAWTSFYSMNIYLGGTRAYPVDTCGYLVPGLASNELCCISSLDTSRATGSNGIASGANILLQTHPSDSLVSKSEIVENMPASAANVSYCFLQTQILTNASSSVFGMESFMVAADGGCTSIGSYYSGSPTFANYSTLQCLPNATLILYNGEAGDCKSATSLVFDVSSKGVISGFGAGNVNSDFLTVQNTSNIGIGWITYSPTSLKIPIFKDWSEITAVVCVVASILLNAGRSVHVYYVNRRASTSFAEKVIPGALLMYACERAFFTYYVGYISNDLYLWCVAVTSWTLAIGSTAQAKYAYDFYFDHVFEGDFGQDQRSRWRSFAAWITVLFFLAFGGGLVMSCAYAIIYSSGTNSSTPANANKNLITWYFMHPLWILFVLIGNMIPTYWVYKQLIRKRQKAARVGDLTKSFDMRSKVSFIAQSIVLAIFILTLVLQLTSFIGNDRVFTSLIAFQMLLESIHSATSIYIMVNNKNYMLEQKAKRARKRHNPAPGDTITKLIEPAMDKLPINSLFANPPIPLVNLPRPSHHPTNLTTDLMGSAPTKRPGLFPTVTIFSSLKRGLGMFNGSSEIVNSPFSIGPPPLDVLGEEPISLHTRTDEKKTVLLQGVPGRIPIRATAAVSCTMSSPEIERPVQSPASRKGTDINIYQAAPFPSSQHLLEKEQDEYEESNPFADMGQDHGESSMPTFDQMKKPT